MNASATAPLLTVVDLRVDVDEVPACDGIALASTGTRVLVLGGPRVLYEATAGLVPILRGSVSVRGTLVPSAVERRVVAGVSRDAPMPPRWSVLEYVMWNARLGGIPRGDVAAAATAALARLHLGPLAKTRLDRLVPHARRATLVASALATGAHVIVLEDPLGGLADDVARGYADVLAGALEEHAWIVFAPRIDLISPLAAAADEAIVLRDDRVVAQGAPVTIASADRRFIARVAGAVDGIGPALSARGAHIEQHGAHVVLDLGESMSTSELFAVCAGAGIAVIELVPIARHVLR